MARSFYHWARKVYEWRAGAVVGRAASPRLTLAIVLPNGRLLCIRPLRRCEEDAVHELYDHLSPRTRFLRFFSQMPRLSNYMLRILACVDYVRQLALVAEHDNGNGSEIVGLASWNDRRWKRGARHSRRLAATATRHRARRQATAGCGSPWIPSVHREHSFREHRDTTALGELGRRRIDEDEWQHFRIRIRPPPNKVGASILCSRS
jgi:hypothetical protein